MDLSFYGGRQGIPFKIVGSYKSIDAMITAFTNDSEGVEVGYGDYVLINTEEALRNTDNGKLFQRTLNPDNPRYIGKIIGPAGYSPNVYFGDYDELIEERHTVLTPEDAKRIKFSESTSKDKISLIPGTDTSVISAILKSERKFDDNNGEETDVTIGLQIPYHNLNIEAFVGSNPYTEDNLIKTTESGPFYSKWALTVPKGVKGSSPCAIYIRKGLKELEGQIKYKDSILTDAEIAEYDNKNVVIAEIFDFANKAEGEFVYYELLGEQLVSHHALYVYDVLENLKLEAGQTVEQYLKNNYTIEGDNADFAVINVQSKEGEKVTQSNFYAYVNNEWKNIGGFEVNDINFISANETQGVNLNALNFIYYEAPSNGWVEGRA